MKKQNLFKRKNAILALFMCAVLLFSTICLSSCGFLDFGDEDEDKDEDEGESKVVEVTDDEAYEGDDTSSGSADGTGENGDSDGTGENGGADGTGDVPIVNEEGCVSVVRVKKGVFAGTQLTADNLELVSVHESGVPDGAIRTIDAIVGKYATINIFLGEYVFPRMISDEKPEENSGFLEYVVVTDEIEVTENKDITKELQSLIDKYPGRTIYFDDGVYNVSETLNISAEADKAVTLRLSNYAVIKALSTWKGDGAMIAIGAGSDAAKAEGAENTIMGGVIDGSGVAKLGVSLENCVKPLVSNVTFKSLKTSVWAKSTAKSVNIESITVNGDASADSVGLVIDSSSGIVSTSYIANVSTAVKNSGKYNEFRNVSAIAKKDSSAECGFEDSGENSIFGLCTAQDFAVGYSIADSVKSVYEACNVYWTSAKQGTQVAFDAKGTFNSVISGCTVKFFDASSANAYIKLATKGSGVIKVPIFDEALCDDKAYKNVLADSVIPLN